MDEKFDQFINHHKGAAAAADASFALAGRTLSVKLVRFCLIAGMRPYEIARRFSVSGPAAVRKQKALLEAERAANDFGVCASVVDGYGWALEAIADHTVLLRFYIASRLPTWWIKREFGRGKKRISRQAISTQRKLRREYLAKLPSAGLDDTERLGGLW